MQEINVKYNLKSLLENYRVVIPLIQRDYAQGRKDKRTTEVRKKLLQDINTALIDTNVGPLDLNLFMENQLMGVYSIRWTTTSDNFILGLSFCLQE